MHLELVVFDIAGTTVNDPDGVNGALRAALSAVGVPVTRAEVNAVMGIAKPEAIRILLDEHGQNDLQVRRGAIHDDFVARMLSFYKTDPSVQPIPGTEETFRALRAAGIKAALDTGFSRPITRIILERLGWRDGGLIDASVTSDEVARGRPFPDMIEHLMRRLGVTDTARVAKVGDTPADLQEGTNARCGMVIGVTGGSHTAAELHQHPHTHLIGSVAELPVLLRALGKC